MSAVLTILAADLMVPCSTKTVIYLETIFRPQVCRKINAYLIGFKIKKEKKRKKKEKRRKKKG